MSDLTLSLERAIFFEDQQASNIIFSLKKYFCGHPGELFFCHPVRRKQTYHYFWPHQKIKVERQFASVSEDTPLLCFHPLQQARSHQRSRFHRAN